MEDLNSGISKLCHILERQLGLLSTYTTTWECCTSMIKRNSLNQFEYPILLKESLTTGKSLDQKKTGGNIYYDTS